MLLPIIRKVLIARDQHIETLRDHVRFARRVLRTEIMAVGADFAATSARSFTFISVNGVLSSGWIFGI